MKSQELVQRRNKLGLTQKEMARCLMMSLRTYQEWEQQRAKIPDCVELAVRYIETNPDYVESRLTYPADPATLGVII